VTCAFVLCRATLFSCLLSHDSGLLVLVHFRLSSWTRLCLLTRMGIVPVSCPSWSDLTSENLHCTIPIEIAYVWKMYSLTNIGSGEQGEAAAITK
jgi:hypothetical protein